MILDYTKRNMALWLAGSTTDYPTYMMIGSGSGTAISSQSALIAPRDRQLCTGVSGTTKYKIAFQGDWTCAEVSGTKLTEFGVCVSGSTTTGSMWSRTSLPSITFDGTNELQVQENWEIY